MQSIHPDLFPFSQAGGAVQAAPDDFPRPIDGVSPEGRDHKADLSVSLRYAQSAFSDALGRYIEL